MSSPSLYYCIAAPNATRKANTRRNSMKQPDDHTARGPKPEHLKIEGDWEDAVKKALTKPPPTKPATPETKKPPRKERP